MLWGMCSTLLSIMPNVIVWPKLIHCRSGGRIILNPRNSLIMSSHLHQLFIKHLGHKLSLLGVLHLCVPVRPTYLPLYQTKIEKQYGVNNVDTQVI